MGFGVFALIGLVFNLIFPTLIGGVLLRAAVALYNKFHPSYQQDDSPEAASSEDHQNEVAPAAQVAVQETDNPYATPQTIEVVASAARTAAIPEPAYLKACGICFLAVIVSVVTLVLGAVFFEFVGLVPGEAVVSSLMLTVFFFALVVVSKLMLPTSFGRSVLVSVAFILIALFTLFLIGLVVMGLMSGFGVLGFGVSA